MQESDIPKLRYDANAIARSRQASAGSTVGEPNSVCIAESPIRLPAKIVPARFQTPTPPDIIARAAKMAKAYHLCL
jgi:hypothetical protein